MMIFTIHGPLAGEVRPPVERRQEDREEAAAIETALRELYGKGGGGLGFARIERDEMTYLQTADDADPGFRVEYQRGSLEEHFAATDEAIDLDAVVAAFVSYAAYTDAWRSRFRWRRMEPSELETTGCLGAVVLLLIAALAVVSAVR